MNLKDTSIIAVDDDTDLLEAMTTFLEMRGATVYPAASGIEAFEILMRRPDCQVIISDVRMPGVNADGLSLARRVRQHELGIPLILVSGFSEGAEKAALEAGASAFFDKPFLWKELEEKIISLLKNVRSAL